MKHMKLSEQLKKMRIDKDLSQEELSEVSNLSLRTIQRLENGESSPREDTIHLLTKALEVPRDYFTEINQTLNNTTEKDNRSFRIKIKLPWFIIGYSIIGLSIGFVLGFICMLLEIMPMNQVSGSLMLAVSFLFGAIGIVIGNKSEMKHRK